MAFGYVSQGLGGMLYCNQSPFPPRVGWGLGTRLIVTRTLPLCEGGVWALEGLCLNILISAYCHASQLALPVV